MTHKFDPKVNPFDNMPPQDDEAVRNALDAAFVDADPDSIALLSEAAADLHNSPTRFVQIHPTTTQKENDR